MIIWGGITSTTSGSPLLVNTGACYNPTTDHWRPVATEGAPKARRHHACVWTGHEMIVWGGRFEDTLGGREVLFDGGRYNPAMDAWTPISEAGAPHSLDPVAAWTGTEMIVLGNDSESTGALVGGIYNPVTDSWRAMSLENGPIIWVCPSVAWDGQEMLIWGCLGNIGLCRFNPLTNTWTPGSEVGEPATRCGSTALWTGTELFVWGGNQCDNNYLNQGGLYNPLTDTWRATTTDGAPIRRGYVVAVWTGTEVLVWGGANSQRFFRDGARYRP